MTSSYSDHELVTRYMLADYTAQWESSDEMIELEDEMRRRFGPEATERTASYFTGVHASPTDILLTAALHPDRLVQIMRGVTLEDIAAVILARGYSAQVGNMGGNVMGVAVRVPGLPEDQCAWISVDDGQTAGTVEISEVAIGPQYVEGTRWADNADTCGRSLVLRSADQIANAGIEYAHQLRLI